jgi:hypothetical protein
MQGQAWFFVDYCVTIDAEGVRGMEPLLSCQPGGDHVRWVDLGDHGSGEPMRDRLKARGQGRERACRGKGRLILQHAGALS